MQQIEKESRVGHKALVGSILLFLGGLVWVGFWTLLDAEKRELSRIDERLERSAEVVVRTVKPPAFQREAMLRGEWREETEDVSARLASLAEAMELKRISFLYRRHGEWVVLAVGETGEASESPIQPLSTYMGQGDDLDRARMEPGAIILEGDESGKMLRGAALAASRGEGKDVVALLETDEDFLGNPLKRLFRLHLLNAGILLMCSLPMLYAYHRRESWNHRERYRVELLVKNAQKMEAVGRLAGGVAHDFNNMIGVIMGSADVIRMKLAKGEKVDAELDEILLASKKSAEVTSHLLAMSQKHAASPEVINLNEGVEQSLKMLRRLIGEDIEVVWQPDNDVPPVLMDPTQLDQILMNLCLNSRDAMTGSGIVVLSTENRVLEEADAIGQEPIPPGEYTCLRVQDNGKGIPGELLDRIMDPFYTTKVNGMGTGLGLAIVYGHMKKAGGHVQIHSEPGEGTFVDLFWPAGPESALDQKAKSQPALPLGKGETVLLVEDHPMMLELMLRMLRGLGYLVLSYDDPRKALDKAEKYHAKIDLLVTDLVMPGMNGRELSDRLREAKPETRVLFISGYDLSELQRRGIETDDAEFITKPFTRWDLGLAIQRALHGEEALEGLLQAKEVEEPAEDTIGS